MNRATEPEVTFRPLEERDFPILSAWFAEPHVRRFYQKTSVTLAEVAAEYGPCVRAEEPGICHFAIMDALRLSAVLSQRRLSGVGAPHRRRRRDQRGPVHWRPGKGLGRAALSGYLKRIAFPFFSTETRAHIAHERLNTAALRCSRAAGFLPLRGFREDGAEMVLLAMNRGSEERRST